MRRLAALLAAAALLCRAGCGEGGASAEASRVLVSASAAPDAPDGAASREAYVTFVVSEEYVLGARVLGQSLRESGTVRYGRSTRAHTPRAPRN